MAQCSNVVENYSCYDVSVTANFHISADLTNCIYTSFCLVFLNGFDDISYSVDFKTDIFLFKKDNSKM